VQSLLLQDCKPWRTRKRASDVELRRRHWPTARRTAAHPEGLQTSRRDVRKFFKSRFGRGHDPVGCGNVEWEPLKDQVERFVGDCGPAVIRRCRLARPAWTGASRHGGTQTQIAVAYPSVPFARRILHRAARSGPVRGMGARCHRVPRSVACATRSRSYQTVQGRACVLCYAGTTSERAQESLDVMMQELPGSTRLTRGSRARPGRPESSVIMQEESTPPAPGRSPSTGTTSAGCVHREIQAAIDALTPEGIVRHGAPTRRATAPS